MWTLIWICKPRRICWYLSSHISLQDKLKRHRSLLNAEAKWVNCLCTMSSLDSVPYCGSFMAGILQVLPFREPYLNWHSLMIVVHIVVKFRHSIYFEIPRLLLNVGASLSPPRDIFFSNIHWKAAVLSVIDSTSPFHYEGECPAFISYTI